MHDPSPDATGEVARIRDAYAARDRSSGRHPAIREAYRRINAQRLRAMHELLRDVAPPPGGRILDVGCGTGSDLGSLLQAGWSEDRIAGVDLLPWRVEAARRALPGVDLRVVDGDRLPFDAGTFDAATAVTVFSSILDPGVGRALFAEMERVVRPGGLLLVYDFVIRKPSNPHVRALPIDRLRDLGRPPDGSRRLSPLLQLVAAGAAVHPRAADLAWRLAPPTHRLSWWRVGSGSG